MMRTAIFVVLGLTLVCGNPTYEGDSSYDDQYNDVKQIVDYDAINDYYGNEQSKKEHIDDYGTSGEYRTLLPDGRRQVVTYESGPYGHLANVDYIPTYAPAYTAPAYQVPASTYNAPAYKAAHTYKAAPVHKAAPVYKPAYVHTSSRVKYVMVPRYNAPVYAARAYATPVHAAPSYHSVRY